MDKKSRVDLPRCNPSAKFIRRRPVMRHLTTLKRIVAILILIAATAVVLPAQERYDKDLLSMARNFLNGAEVQDIWPSDVFDKGLLLRPDRITVLFPVPIKSRPINGHDWYFYNGDALDQLLGLIKSKIDDYNTTVRYRVGSDDFPEKSALISEAVSIRICKEVLQNVSIDAEIYFSGKKPDGNMVFSACRVYSVSKADIAKEIADETIGDGKNQSVVDLLAQVERIKRILDQNPVQTN